MNDLLDETAALAAASTEAMGAVCSLDNYLAQPDHTMDARIAAARAKLGKDAVILGHHYQRDEVIRFADYTGDSYKLSKVASETSAKYMLFCGVHFMAETAEVLAQPWQQVILPDLNAGCSMADMAEIGQVEDCWDALERAGLTGTGDQEPGTSPAGLIPLTYMNSAAAIKAFCGERGGLVCTSSNARGAFEWAFARAEKILFLPDQHLGRNTAFAMGIPLSEMAVWDPYMINGGLTAERLRSAKVILWKGHCSVHQRFLPEHVDRVRREEPGMQVIVHPECRWEVCQKADAIGSTERIIKVIEDAPSGASFAVGTEIHLVNRLAKRFAPLGKRIITLDDAGCLCTTMYRISPQHLAWALENLVEGRVVNRIQVDDDVKQWARVALDRMLEIKV
ncbi:MAG TPA: quinolinate synthase NadA [Edaphobacter sp.]|nr:quinolinate synthase NadA [Edaphobacter sp.]HEU5340378.1 quinolinate synthase NadA [Edaphobacter sp.]